MNNNFYLIHITNVGTDAEARELIAYPTQPLAEIAFHEKASYDMQMVDSADLMVVDSMMNVFDDLKKIWRRETVETPEA